ncbi:hypothetical protein IPJ72_05320 [Candidatus Peregrinibacteria bacterium]|nr:MAG: hypothetical protein IPJ72_05320 [Candidatus Peregrinibacteria bacterium]
MRFFRVNDDTIKFRYADGRLEGSISGIIVVPHNVSIDLTQLINQNVIVQDDRGRRLYTPSSGFGNVVGQDTITFIPDGTIQISGVGTIQSDAPASSGVTLPPPSNPFNNSNSTTSNGPVQLDTGVGPSNPNPNGELPVVPNTPATFPQCGVGSQAVKDQCCYHVYHNTPTVNCSGSWGFNESEQRCAFTCFDGQPPVPEEPNPVIPTPGVPQTDPVSLTCSKQVTVDGQNVCCDDNLSNQLHIGPRPGYPDCIGRWVFNKQAFECQFRCSSFGEMKEILQELRSRQEQREL